MFWYDIKSTPRAQTSAIYSLRSINQGGAWLNSYNVSYRGKPLLSWQLHENPSIIFRTINAIHAFYPEDFILVPRFWYETSICILFPEDPIPKNTLNLFIRFSVMLLTDMNPNTIRQWNIEKHPVSRWSSGMTSKSVLNRSWTIFGFLF